MTQIRVICRIAALVGIAVAGPYATCTEYAVRVEKNVSATMRDGVNLKADIYRPESIKPEEIRPGQKVLVEAGPLNGLLGIFECEISDRERVVVLLDALHYQGRVLIDKRYLHAVAQVV